MTNNIQFSSPEPEPRAQFASKSELLQYYWQQFNNEFPRENDCVDALIKMVKDISKGCYKCGSKNIRKSNNSRVNRCRTCKVESYSLAGTFFDHIRKAKPWLGALWFMDKGIKINSSEFSRLAKIATSSARMIFQRYTFALVSRMLDLAELPSKAFSPVFIKRSRVSPAGEHPIAEEAVFEMEPNMSENTTGTLDNAPTETDKVIENISNSEMLPTETLEELSDIEKKTYDALSTEPQEFESLFSRTGLNVGILTGTLVILNLKGLIVSVDGNRFSLPPKAPNRNKQANLPESEASKFSSSFIEYVSSTFHGISRKYLQCYLAWHWCLTDRDHWSPGKLFKHLSSFKKASFKEIRDYVSPEHVKVSPHHS